MSLNLPVALVAVKVSGSVACTPPVGETGAGAETFKVEPSAFALESGGVALEGEVGACDDLPHATASASRPAAVHKRTLRCISWNSGKTRSLTQGARAGW